MSIAETVIDTVVDQDLAAMMSAVFAEHRRSDVPRESHVTVDPQLWAQLAELGLTRLTESESTGGSGAGWHEAAELLRAAAFHGVLVPVAENDLLAGWLLESCGLPTDDARRTACLVDGKGIAHNVPWASQADRIVVLSFDGTDCRVRDLDSASVAISAGVVNLAGEPRDTVAIDESVGSGSGVVVGSEVVDQLMLRGSLVRAIQTCGALERILDLSIAHASDRVQFGRPLAKFQAVQQQIADIASETALARAATEAAVAAASENCWEEMHLRFLISAARSCVGHATTVVVRAAHQVHGAIGTTLEHPLHEFTQPALAWRSEFGSIQRWDEQLTEMAKDAGRNGLWPLIAG